jgi:DNA-binding SARP family transcriptional activator/TolB-like protein
MQPQSTVTTTIRLLGDLIVWHGGTDVRPRGRKARAIIGIIGVSASQRIRRDELADLLWSDRGEHQARSSLRQALGEIKGILPGVENGIAIGRDQISFAPGQVTTDVATIVAACEQRDLELLARCLGETDGVFMAGYDGLAAGLDEWLRFERPRNHGRVVAAVLEQEALIVENARSADIHAILRAIERLDPYNELVARLGMQADHAAGDGASLHRRYRALCEDLDREFGSKPATETRTLFEHLTVEPSLGSADLPSVVGDRNGVGRGRTPPVVLVNPIAATDDDPQSAQIASAATDDIRVALARYTDVRVLALDTLDLTRIEGACSSALSAYVLSGTLRMAPEGARVNLQLGNVGSSVVIWSEQLRLDRGTIEEAIERIVTKAVGAVVPAIDRDLSAGASARSVAHDDSVALYARGRYLTRVVRTLPAVLEGIDLLGQAITLDADHIGARLLLAQLYNTDLWQQQAGHDVADYRRRALALIQEAAAIDPGNMRIQVRLAWCHLRRGEWAVAERRLRAAAEALPYDADGINEAAVAFAFLGEIDLAIELMQRAFALNPFPPADYHADYAILMAMKGDHLASEEHFDAFGETRLQYLGARLSNIARLPHAAARRETLRAEFFERFGAAWQPARAYRPDDLSEWLAQTYVFREPDRAASWQEGFIAALN